MCFCYVPYLPLISPCSATRIRGLRSYRLLPLLCKPTLGGHGRARTPQRFSIGTSIKSIQREDVRAMGILLHRGKYHQFTRQYRFDMFRDESLEIVLARPALTALKSLPDLSTASLRPPDAGDRYSRLVHCLISSCVLNIDKMG